MRGSEIYLRSKYPPRPWFSNFGVNRVTWEPCSNTESRAVFTEKWTQHICSGAEGPAFPMRVPVTVTRGVTFKPKCPILTENPPLRGWRSGSGDGKIRSGNDFLKRKMDGQRELQAQEAAVTETTQAWETVHRTI